MYHIIFFPSLILVPRRPHRMTEIDSNQQHGKLFVHDLPFDIISKIFSYLDQTECLTCMAVDRNWYYGVPHYVQSIWKTLEVLGSGDKALEEMINNKRRKFCLGKHVKTIIFDTFGEEETNLYALMQYLLDCDCKQLETMEFYECKTSKDQPTFIRLLYQLGTQLTHLTLEEHGSNVPFIDILSVCPNLTHFTYAPEYSAWESYMIYDSEPFIENRDDLLKELLPEAYKDRHSFLFTNLTYLCLNCPLKKQIRLEPILRKCPNLQHLIGTSFGFFYEEGECYYPPYNDATVDLDELFSWCPKLIYYMANNGYYEAPDIDDDNDKSCANKVIEKNQQNASDNDNIVKLTHLGLCEEQGYDQIASFLNKHKHTLECLHILRYQYTGDNSEDNEDGQQDGSSQEIDWSPILSKLQLDRLRELMAVGIYFQNDDPPTTFFNMLSHLPVIEVIDVLFALPSDPYFGVDIETTALPTILAMSPLQHLHTLRLFLFSFEDEFVLISMLERMPVLGILSMRRSQIPSLKNPTIAHLLMKLKDLTLSNITVASPSPIASSSSSIVSRDDDNEEEHAPNDAVVLPPAFFYNMNVENKYYQKQSCLEKIHLRNLSNVTLELLDAISVTTPALKQLEVVFDHPITCNEEDQRKFLQFIKNLSGVKYCEGDVVAGAATTFSTIEKLDLGNVCYISNDVFMALARLPRLKAFLVGMNDLEKDQSSTDIDPVKRMLDGMDPSTIVSLLLNKSSDCLTKVKFFGVRQLLEKSSMTSVIKELLFSKQKEDASLPQWTVSHTVCSEDGELSEDITIKCENH
ncbi:hypothetical protein BDA99DRAFT_608253 [Phascolomyces articulosus]|uniref:F-box domain-containing protein n=1 Tax=Phascolomyces articulosus TaxID=60185 RepID=A0AAD5JRX1_9FUNG|nr:hypothetical protein BDA99DRAFT_608253 [Phascolomyces articulosus]